MARRFPLVLIALFFLMGVSMAFFPSPHVLMSEMEGRLLNSSDQPAAKVRLVRSWEWSWTGRKGSDETITDEEGRFSFPEVTGRSITARLLPHEPSIVQKVVAELPEGEIEIWRADKTNYRPNGELRGDPLHVVCGLEELPGSEKDRLFASRCVPALSWEK